MKIRKPGSDSKADINLILILLIMFDVHLFDKNAPRVLVLILGLFLSDLSEGTRKTKYAQNFKPRGVTKSQST